MSADDEYTAFVGTRWAGLVRSAVLLGCPRHAAEQLVRDVLLRGYRGWDAAWRHDLTDEHVAGLLLSAVRAQADRATHRALDELPEAAHAADRDASTDLVRALDVLDHDSREALVLHYVTELTRTQAARVLGVPPVILERLLLDSLDALAETEKHEPLSCGGEAP